MASSVTASSSASILKSFGGPPKLNVGPEVVADIRLRQRSIPRPLEPSYDRLEFFTRPSLSSAMVGRYHYGEITEHPDWHRLAPELADMLARALAAAR